MAESVLIVGMVRLVCHNIFIDKYNFCAKICRSSHHQVHTYKDGMAYFDPDQKPRNRDDLMAQADEFSILASKQSQYVTFGRV